MRSVIVTAKTREEAIQQALQQLGCERHEVHVEILEEGSKGFFGIGARDVKIRVTAEHLPDEEPDKKEQKPEKKSAASARNHKSTQRSKGRGRRERDRRRHTERKTQKKNTSSNQPVNRETSENQDETKTDAETASPQEKRELSPEECDRAKALLQEMIQLMGIEATVDSQITDSNELLLTVNSPDSSLLIGRHGKNLQALQYLINRIVHAGENSDAPERILVDIAGYTDRRKAELEDLARRIAKRVKETGKRFRLKPMPPQERRIIHLTLQDDPDVRTFSVGEAGSRCVTIALRDERRQNKKRTSSRNKRGQRRQRRTEEARSSWQAETTTETAVAEPQTDVAQTETTDDQLNTE